MNDTPDRAKPQVTTALELAGGMGVLIRGEAPALEARPSRPTRRRQLAAYTPVAVEPPRA